MSKAPRCVKKMSRCRLDAQEDENKAMMENGKPVMDVYLASPHTLEPPIVHPQARFLARRILKWTHQEITSKPIRHGNDR